MGCLAMEKWESFRKSERQSRQVFVRASPRTVGCPARASERQKTLKSRRAMNGQPCATLYLGTSRASAQVSVAPLFVHDVEQGQTSHVSAHVLREEFQSSPLDFGRPA